MTHIPITSGERVEVLSLPEDHYARRLLADLDAAEAERDELRAALIASGNAVGAALTDRCSSQFLCNVPAEVTLVYKRIAAQRDRAEAERDDYRERLADARQKLIAMEEQAMVDDDEKSLRPFDERLRRVEAERDALKAKLDRCETNLRAANSDCADADVRMAELKAKLAALVEAASEFYEATYADLESCLTSEDIVLRGNLGDAIAAAKGGMS